MGPRTEVILVAGGQGRRMRENTPKAFLPVAGRSLFAYSLKTFRQLPEILKTILVVPPGSEERAREICRMGEGEHVLPEIVCGGPRRQDSVRNGMDHLAPDTEVVLIHDAARPFSDEALIRRVITAALEQGAAVPGVPIVDTLKRVNPESRVETTVDRRNLVAVQTPQGFQTVVLRQAYQHAWQKKLTATDDAGLVELLGRPVIVVEGNYTNFKITKPHDLELAEYLVSQKKCLF